MNTKFFPPYRLLIEVSVLKAGPASFNRDRDWCSCFIMPKKKYNNIILVICQTNRASSKTEWVVTKCRATEKVQYLYQFNICSA